MEKLARKLYKDPRVMAKVVTIALSLALLINLANSIWGTMPWSASIPIAIIQLFIVIFGITVIVKSKPDQNSAQQDN